MRFGQSLRAHAQSGERIRRASMQLCRAVAHQVAEEVGLSRTAVLRHRPRIPITRLLVNSSALLTDSFTNNNNLA
jgi:hypothetical protein